MKRFVLSALMSGLAFAQNPPTTLAFEVASVKPVPPSVTPGSGSFYYKVDDGRADMGGMSLDNLVRLAYRDPWDLVEPDWLTNQTFELHAKIPAGVTKDQLPEMLQSFLAERFGLKAHHEERIIPVYAMTVAKDGPKFKESPPGDDANAGSCNGGFRKQCRQVTMQDFARILTQPTRLAARFPAFANMPGALDRPVIDMTGLTAKYTFEFVSGRVGAGRGADINPDAEIVTAADALKTLGLKLEPIKHTFDIIVVDHIERMPTDN